MAIFRKFLPRLPRRRTRSGFTLIELVVVIALVALLVSLIAPAVQAAREAARRAACASSLRQLALACHLHHDARGALPTGGWGLAYLYDPARGPGRRQPGGWCGAVLPYLEAGAVLDGAASRDPAARDAVLAAAQAAPLAAFRCPSRFGDARGPALGRFPFRNGPHVAEVAKTDYAANAGAAPHTEQFGPPSVAQGDLPGPRPWVVRPRGRDGGDLPAQRTGLRGPPRRGLKRLPRGGEVRLAGRVRHRRGPRVRPEPAERGGP